MQIELPSNPTCCGSCKDWDRNPPTSHPSVLVHIPLSKVRGCLSKEGSWQAKVGLILLGQRPLDVSDVIFRFDALLKGAVPTFEDAFDDLDTRKVNIVDCRPEAALVLLE